jgi:hypothetical protein
MLSHWGQRNEKPWLDYAYHLPQLHQKLIVGKKGTHQKIEGYYLKQANGCLVVKITNVPCSLQHFWCCNAPIGSDGDSSFTTCTCQNNYSLYICSSIFVTNSRYANKEVPLCKYSPRVNIPQIEE